MAEAFFSGAALPQADVAVVGAGPVGSMVANLRGLAGVKVTVLERNEGLSGRPRAIAYDAETLRLFALVGLFDWLAPRLDASFVCLNDSSADKRTVALRFGDPEFMAWVKRYGVTAVLVRLFRFIADRLSPRRKNLPALTAFAQACRRTALREAA
jgi:2-polyprenyl-6-methoxyphenol hydroxylase-like FAD-dependent oxidoreductase